MYTCIQTVEEINNSYVKMASVKSVTCSLAFDDVYYVLLAYTTILDQSVGKVIHCYVLKSYQFKSRK